MAVTINYNGKTLGVLDINESANLSTAGYCMDTDLEIINTVKHYDGTVEDEEV